MQTQLLDSYSINALHNQQEPYNPGSILHSTFSLDSNDLDVYIIVYLYELLPLVIADKLFGY